MAAAETKNHRSLTASNILSLLPRQRPSGEALPEPPPISGPAHSAPAINGTATNSGSITTAELRRICSALSIVAVRTERYGSWQEYASFVLGTNDGGWHIVGFTDPLASELVPLLRALPDFDDQLLLELIGTRTQRLTILWRVSVGLP